MKKWYLVGLLILLVVGLMIWQRENIFNLIPSVRARRMIYPTVTGGSKYGGVGRVTRQAREQILVTPKGMGRPVFVDAKHLSDYPSDAFEITVIPAQEQLIYTVAKFMRWEEIAGSKDKYMVVAHPQSGIEEKYRIGLERSRLYSSESAESTRLSVEQVTNDDFAVNVVENAEVTQLAELGYPVVKQLIRSGDIVILFPVFDPPQWAGQDDDGYTTVSTLVLRRVGGVAEVNEEIRRERRGE